MDYKKQYINLLKRFRHLMESDFIRSFDEWDAKKQGYKRDIKESDYIKKHCLTVGIEAKRCSECNNILKASGEIIVNGLTWSADRFNTCIGYDRETNEILINENVLMTYIQICNPLQEKRPIKIVDQDSFMKNLCKRT